MDILISFYNVINLCGKMPIQSESITDAIEKLFKIKIDERGRIYIPCPVRQRFSIKLGEKLYLKSKTVISAYILQLQSTNCS